MDNFEIEVLESIKSAIVANRIILPSLPEVAMQVRELSARDDCSHDQLEREIARDAAISARLLKVANSSALHRGGDHLSSLHQAISRLGLDLVRSLVTQLAILQVMHSGMDRSQLQEFVDHSLSVSAICHALADKHPHLDGEQAALAGLLHDIGKLPLRQYVDLHEHLRQDEQRLERSLHPLIGGVLLRHWQLSDELVAAVEEHEDLKRDPETLADYADLVIIANLVHYGAGDGRYANIVWREIPALRKCLGGDTEEELKTRLQGRLALSLSMGSL